MKKMLKAALSVALAGAMVLSMTACGSNAPSNSSSDSESGDKTKLYVVNWKDYCSDDPDNVAAFEEAKNTKGMPTAIIAHSVKGKGVSFMENSCDWHGKAPNDEEFAIAMADLEKIGAQLEKEAK